MKIYAFLFTLLILITCLNVSGQTVYKTKTGSKYHTSSHYSNSTPISLSEAINQGLGACSVCNPPKQVNKESTEVNRLSSPSNNSNQESNSQIVYITKTGSKYHTRGHYTNSTAIGLVEAKKQGLEACAVCKPTTKVTEDGIENNSVKSSTSEVTPLQSTPKVEKSTKPASTTTSKQCKGTTKAGARCKRNTTDPSGYCYQHK